MIQNKKTIAQVRRHLPHISPRIIGVLDEVPNGGVVKFYFLLSVLRIPNTALLNAQLNRKIQHSPIVFTRVAVIDTAEASAQQDMTVVIVGDRIADLGKAAELRRPKFIIARTLFSTGA